MRLHRGDVVVAVGSGEGGARGSISRGCRRFCRGCDGDGGGMGLGGVFGGAEAVDVVVVVVVVVGDVVVVVEGRGGRGGGVGVRGRWDVFESHGSVDGRRWQWR